MRNETRINSAGEEYTVKVKEEIPNWLIDLTLAVSRRANNSFAIDYKSDGVLDGNQLIIKQYLEARSRVFECHGKLREWKGNIESLGNITRLHCNIGLAAKAFNVSLELNIKDLKIDPYGMIFADNKNINVQDIFKEAAKDRVNYDATRAKLRFNDLSSEQRDSIIASCLSATSWEELNQCYSTLQLAKEVMKDHALLICSSYHISNNGTASMGERIIQLNLNYETIQKHAGIAPYKYYLKDISTYSSLNSCSSYQSLMKFARDVISNDQHASSALTNNKLMSLVNNYIADIDNYNWDNKELIELKRCDLLESQKALSNLKQEQQANENFIDILLPHYLGRIYEQQGAEIIAKWEAVKAANPDVDAKELIERVQSNPSMLGTLPGIGIGTIFGVSISHRKSIEQVGKLGRQLLKYEENMARLSAIQYNNLIREQEQKIVVLKEELNVLEALKANTAEEKFLSSLKTMQAGSGLNTHSFKLLLVSDEVQDLLCEYYNNQNEQYTRVNAPDRVAVDESIGDVVDNVLHSAKQEHIQESTANSKTNTLSSTREGTTSRRRDRNRTKEPVLRFDKVQDALTSSDIERVFRQYAASIRGGVGAIKRSGTEISMGSLA